MEMKTYRVLQDGWLEDGFGIGALRDVGQEVRLYPVQAEYLLASEQIGELAPPLVPPRKKGAAEGEG